MTEHTQDSSPVPAEYRIDTPQKTMLAMVGVLSASMLLIVPMFLTAATKTVYPLLAAVLIWALVFIIDAKGFDGKLRKFITYCVTERDAINEYNRQQEAQHQRQQSSLTDEQHVNQRKESIAIILVFLGASVFVFGTIFLCLLLGNMIPFVVSGSLVAAFVGWARAVKNKHQSLR
jgi:hypothetical protein